ncbi:MAG: hypothetical protein AAF593_00775 [Planctomycetota bacterium]
MNRLMELVGEHCTNGQIENVIRKKKKALAGQRNGDGQLLDRDYRITHPNRSALLNHFGALVLSRNLEVAKAISLLRDSEESGRQHILFYCCKRQHLSDYSDGTAVAERLWGSFDIEKFQPRFTINPSQFEWADFRNERSPNHGVQSWVLKGYDEHEIHREVNRENLSERRYRVVYEKQNVRAVYVIRYRKYRDRCILELRIPVEAGGSVASLRRAIDLVFENAYRGINFDHFVPLDLAKARSFFWTNEASMQNVYRIPQLRFIDSDHGRTTMTARTPYEHLSAVPDRAAAASQFSKVEEGLMYWLQRSDNSTPAAAEDPIDGSLRVEVCRYMSNEIRIGSQANPKEVDYVCHQFCQNA